MPRFSQKSRDNLSSCHLDLQILFNEVIKWFDCTVICGHRSKEDQDEAYRKGFSQVQYPNSRHNSVPSNAVDVVPYPIDWNNTERMKFFIGFVLGTARQLKEQGKINNEIIRGIDWDGDTFLKDHNFQDHPHFQIK